MIGSYKHYTQQPSRRSGGWLFFRVAYWVLVWGVVAIVGFAIILAIAILPSWSTAMQVKDNALAGRTELLDGKTLVEEQRFQEAAEKFAAAHEHLNTAEESLRAIKGRWVFRLPVIKDQVAIGEDLLVISNTLAKILVEVSVFGHDVQQIINSPQLNFANLDDDTRGKILERLVALGDKFGPENTDLDTIQLAWQDIQNRDKLFFWSPILRPLEDELPDVFQKMAYFRVVAQTFPKLVGYPLPQNYLLLLANNNELRPGGGFIGTYGIVTMKNGAIDKYFTDDIYNLDFPAKDRVKEVAPDPIRLFLGQKFLYMRDANWSPDFPSSAEAVESFYHLEANPGETINGVISVTPDVIADLLRLVGPISVDGYTFTADNLAETLEYIVEIEYAIKNRPVTERKDIIGDMAVVLQQRLYHLPSAQWKNLADVVRSNVERKQLVGYFKDENLQSFMEKHNWAGRIDTTDEDYLMLVDANLAALKTDSVMQREISYTLTTDEKGDTLSTAAVKYTNPGPKSQFVGDYRTYARLYVPENVQLISIQADGVPIKAKDYMIHYELGKTAFGLTIFVPVGTSKTIIYTYKLPKTIRNKMNDGDYKLHVQKQLGVRTVGLKLRLDFPYTLRAYGAVEESNSVLYSGMFDRDDVYTVIFK